ncbi:unnamed protein product [Ceratitis capitata]|uniref:(Mediterranean fruit fly) hypothetical protein n=1 Tax=Ceratitis capitata TaxID=7213 RepID=A0A811UIS9_CERCA|nr:unnamed protein product [Ceratitis capitata]
MGMVLPVHWQRVYNLEKLLKSKNDGLRMAGCGVNSCRAAQSHKRDDVVNNTKVMSSSSSSSLPLPPPTSPPTKRPQQP